MLKILIKACEDKLPKDILEHAIYECVAAETIIMLLDADALLTNETLNKMKGLDCYKKIIRSIAAYAI